MRQVYNLRVLVVPILLIAACETPEFKSGEANITRLVINIGGVSKNVAFNGTTRDTVAHQFAVGVVPPAAFTVTEIIVSAKATTTVSRQQSLAIANNQATITVTAQNGSTQTYTIYFEFTHAPRSSEKKITQLVISVGGVSKNIVFNGSIRDTVAHQFAFGTVPPTTFVINQISVSSEATTDVGEQQSLAIVNNQATITVAAQDGSTQPYTLFFLFTQATAPVTATAPGPPRITLKAGTDAVSEIDVIVALATYTGTNADGSTADIDSLTVAYSKDNFTATTATIGTTVSNPVEATVMLNGLLPNTPYFVYATATNSAALTSVSSDTIRLTTAINPTSPTLPGVVTLGVIPNNLSAYSEPARSALEPYTGGAAVVARYVTVAGAGTKDGSSWDNAAGNSQLKSTLNGIGDPSSKVYLLLVAAGSYDAGGILSMKNNVAIIGGWEPTGGWTRTETDTTTFSGGNTHQVFRNNDVDHTAVLYGAKITAGAATGNGGGMQNVHSAPTLINITFSNNSANFGGAMYNENNNGVIWPVITNNVFRGNTAELGGGGLYNNQSSPVLTDVIFEGNGAKSGGGMYNSLASSPTLTDVTFLGNTADENGGGMYNYQSSPTLTGSTFSSNKANEGGGMYNSNSSPTLTGVTFSANSTTGSEGSGGGMYNYQNSSPALTNMTVEGNTANKGGGMYNSQSSPILTSTTFSGNNAQFGGGMFNDNDGGTGPVVVNSLFWGNTASSGGAQIALFNQANTDAENITLAYSVIAGGAHSTALAIVENGNSVSITAVGLVAENPNLGILAHNGGAVQTMAITNTSAAKDIGLYVLLGKAGTITTHYYSSNSSGTTWFKHITQSGLTQPGTPPLAAANLTATDATGTARTGQPDAGAYEAR